jgi:glutamate carboxypeptidase
MKALFNIIDGLADEYVEFLIDICNIESKSDNKEGLDRVYEIIKEHGESRGYEIKELILEKAGNVLSLTYNPEGKEKPVCLSAHMDTVFNKGEFGYPPVRREGDRLIGPGVFDCKGGIAVSLLVLDALRRFGYDKRPVKFILQSDEEVQSVPSEGKTIEFMINEAKGAAAFFNCEGKIPGFITTKRKGILRLCLEIKGKASHAGSYFEGVSAVKEAAYKILDLEGKSQKGGITYNCGVIHGGTALNVVPDICKVYIDIRVNDKAEYDTAMEEVKKTARKSFVEGTSCTIEVLSDRAPMVRTEENVKLFEHINGVSQKYGFGKVDEFFSGGGSDAAYTTLAGIPTVDDVGPEGGKYHTKEEFCVIPSIAQSAKLLAASIIEL